jgi:hypothetical protein
VLCCTVRQETVLLFETNELRVIDDGADREPAGGRSDGENEYQERKQKKFRGLISIHFLDRFRWQRCEVEFCVRRRSSRKSCGLRDWSARHR